MDQGSRHRGAPKSAPTLVDLRSQLWGMSDVLNAIMKGVNKIMSALDNLKAAEERDAAATAAAVEEIANLAGSVKNISQQLADAIAANDPAAIQAAAAEIDQHASQLEAAVSAAIGGTPPAPTP